MFLSKLAHLFDRYDRAEPHIIMEREPSEADTLRIRKEKALVMAHYCPRCHHNTDKDGEIARMANLIGFRQPMTGIEGYNRECIKCGCKWRVEYKAQ